MKTKSYDQLVIGILVGALLFLVIEVSISYAYAVTKTPANSAKKIKREYYLEVSQDSIWIESKQGDVYSGTYSQLDSLINVDNL
jgi:hypothetical protein